MGKPSSIDELLHEYFGIDPVQEERERRTDTGGNTMTDTDLARWLSEANLDTLEVK